MAHLLGMVTAIGSSLVTVGSRAKGTPVPDAHLELAKTAWGAAQALWLWAVPYLATTGALALVLIPLMWWLWRQTDGEQRGEKQNQ